MDTYQRCTQHRSIGRQNEGGGGGYTRITGGRAERGMGECIDPGFSDNTIHSARNYRATSSHDQTTPQGAGGGAGGPILPPGMGVLGALFYTRGWGYWGPYFTPGGGGTGGPILPPGMGVLGALFYPRGWGCWGPYFTPGGGGTGGLILPPGVGVLGALFYPRGWGCWGPYSTPPAPHRNCVIRQKPAPAVHWEPKRPNHVLYTKWQGLYAFHLQDHTTTLNWLLIGNYIAIIWVRPR